MPVKTQRTSGFARRDSDNQFSARQSFDAGVIWKALQQFSFPTQTQDAKNPNYRGWRIYWGDANAKIIVLAYGGNGIGDPNAVWPYIRITYEADFDDLANGGANEKYGEFYIQVDLPDGVVRRTNFSGVFWNHAYQFLRAYAGSLGAYACAIPDGPNAGVFSTRIGAMGAATDATRAINEISGGGYPDFSLYGGSFPSAHTVVSNNFWTSRVPQYVLNAPGNTSFWNTLFGKIFWGDGGWSDGYFGITSTGGFTFHLPREYEQIPDAHLRAGQGTFFIDATGGWAAAKLVVIYRRNDGGPYYRGEVPLVQRP